MVVIHISCCGPRCSDFILQKLNVASVSLIVGKTFSKIFQLQLINWYKFCRKRAQRVLDMTKNQNLGLLCKNAKRERCFGAIK